MTLTIGSLFTGYGGLDHGVASVFDAAPIWHSDIKPAACALLAHHYPDVPNLGDVSRVDWARVQRPDILTGGFPCTDISVAGRQAGLIRYGHDRTRSGLWAEMCRAIDELRPALVVAENVRALTSVRADSDVEPCPGCLGDTVDRPLRALGAVLGDLADVGYDASWCGLRASDVGAPHQRFRIFIVAWPAVRDTDSGDRIGWETSGLARETRPEARPVAEPVGIGRVGWAHDPGRLEVGRVTAAGRSSHAADADDPGRQGTEPTRGRDVLARRGRGAAAADADSARREGLEPVAAAPSVAEPQRTARPAADADDDGRRPAGQPAEPEADADTRGQTRAFRARLRAHEQAGFGRQRSSDGNGRAAQLALSLDIPRRRAPIADPDSWGPYTDAVRRWAAVLGRPAPASIERGRNGGANLSAWLTEWMMGLPEGWVADVPGLSNPDKLSLCGDGVVPQQAAEALRRLLPTIPRT